MPKTCECGCSEFNLTRNDATKPIYIAKCVNCGKEAIF